MNRIITIHEDNGIRFCMTEGNIGEKVYKIMVGKDTYYTHLDFDIAVKEYGIARREQADKKRHEEND